MPNDFDDEAPTGLYYRPKLTWGQFHRAVQRYILARAIQFGRSELVR